MRFCFLSHVRNRLFYHMTSRLGVIKCHAIKSINKEWFTDFVTLCNDIHFNVACKRCQNIDVFMIKSDFLFNFYVM